MFQGGFEEAFSCLRDLAALSLNWLLSTNSHPVMQKEKLNFVNVGSYYSDEWKPTINSHKQWVTRVKTARLPR